MQGEKILPEMSWAWTGRRGSPGDPDLPLTGGGD